MARRDDYNPVAKEIFFNNQDTDIVFKDVEGAIKSNRSLLLSHAARHLPNGADPLATATASTISTSGTNTEGNANSFARSNHTHKVEVARFSARANNSVGTTATADTAILTITTPPTGTYAVWAQYTSTHGTNNGQSIGSLYVGGTQVTDSQGTEARPNVNAPLAYSIATEITVDGTQDVSLRIRTNTGTVTYTQRSLLLLRVG
jgi:hypothetical protein